MTCECTWHRVFMGAKLALAAAVVAGAMALSGTAHAATLAGQDASLTGFSSSPLLGTGSSPLQFDADANTATRADRFDYLNAIKVGDGWKIDLQTKQGDGTKENPWYAYIGFQAVADLITISTTVQNPDKSFAFAEAGWSNATDGTGSFREVKSGEQLKLTTAFALHDIKYLVFRWWGTLSPTVAGGVSTLDTTLSAVVPLPAGLVLFLSGLAGLGLLGRYKAKRREPAVA